MGDTFAATGARAGTARPKLGADASVAGSQARTPGGDGAAWSAPACAAAVSAPIEYTKESAVMQPAEASKPWAGYDRHAARGRRPLIG